MSVIAGCSLFDGVMLLADCRMTIRRKSKKDVYVDNIQKLFSLTPTTVLGFVGNIQVASLMISELLKQLDMKSKTGRVDPVSLSIWIPRYLRYKYAQISKKFPQPEVAFMVASVICSRPNLIERARVVEIMERFRLGKLSMQRNWLPGILVEILKTPSTAYGVILADSPFGLLYTLKYPHFTPEYLKPLEYAAIGTGEGSMIEINKNLDWIFAGEVRNTLMEAFALRQTVSHFIDENKIDSVGGLYPCLKIDASGIHLLGYSCEIPAGGTKIELSPTPTGRWVQRNLSSGKEIKILYPWEINFSSHNTDQMFNDVKEAHEAIEKNNNNQQL